MSELAKHAVVKREGRKFSLTIDGQEFPWYLAEHGVRWEMGDVPTLHLSLLVVDSLVIEDASQ